MDDRIMGWTKIKFYFDSGMKRKNLTIRSCQKRCGIQSLYPILLKSMNAREKQDLYIRQKPVELERLVEIARVQSTEYSNRKECIVTTSTRIKQLMEDKTILCKL